MIHTRTATIVFKAPFSLPGLDRTYPAGSYLVTTDEEQLDLSFTAFRRLETRINLRAGPEMISWPVAPSDLEAALELDAKLALA